MSDNIGSADRVIRVIVSLALITLSVLGFSASPTLLWGGTAVGAVLILTAFFRFCPLYRLLGVSTRKVSPR